MSVSCAAENPGVTTSPNSPGGLITNNATPETQALYANMKRLAKTHIMFGHQAANQYGHSWKDIPGKTDVNDVCGSHPAVYGHDFSELTMKNTEKRQEEIETKLRFYVREAYLRGGINTMSWHLVNPVSEKSFYWKDDPVAAVPLIIPGGSHHDAYKEKLRTIAAFAQSVKGDRGELIPMIFRPFHEYDGDWFWWGVPHHCTADEFITLWRFTVSYLRDSLRVKSFMYAISSDVRLNSREELQQYYPGDDYTDMIGQDNYQDFKGGGKGSLAEFERKIRMVSDFAKERNKLCALTETGIEGIPHSTWWTGVLLPLLKDKGLELSYVLVWRNAYNNPTHYFAPFPGQISSDDFVRFREDGYTLFEDDLNEMYRD